MTCFSVKQDSRNLKKNKNITNKILTKRLREMEDSGLITRVENPDNANDVEYYLTEKGKSLNNIIYDLAMFTVNNDEFNLYYTDEEKKEIKSLFKEKLDL